MNMQPNNIIIQLIKIILFKCNDLQVLEYEVKKQGTIKTACGNQSQTFVKCFTSHHVQMLIKYPGKDIC